MGSCLSSTEGEPLAKRKEKKQSRRANGNGRVDTGGGSGTGVASEGRKKKGGRKRSSKASQNAPQDDVDTTSESLPSAHETSKEPSIEHLPTRTGDRRSATRDVEAFPLGFVGPVDSTTNPRGDDNSTPSVAPSSSLGNYSCGNTCSDSNSSYTNRGVKAPEHSRTAVPRNGDYGAATTGAKPLPTRGRGSGSGVLIEATSTPFSKSATAVHNTEEYTHDFHLGKNRFTDDEMQAAVGVSNRSESESQQGTGLILLTTNPLRTCDHGTPPLGSGTSELEEDFGNKPITRRVLMELAAADHDHDDDEDEETDDDNRGNTTADVDTPRRNEDGNAPEKDPQKALLTAQALSDHRCGAREQSATSSADARGALKFTAPHASCQSHQLRDDQLNLSFESRDTDDAGDVSVGSHSHASGENAAVIMQSLTSEGWFTEQVKRQQDARSRGDSSTNAQHVTDSTLADGEQHRPVRDWHDDSSSDGGVRSPHEDYDWEGEEGKGLMNFNEVKATLQQAPVRSSLRNSIASSSSHLKASGAAASVRFGASLASSQADYSRRSSESTRKKSVTFSWSSRMDSLPRGSPQPANSDTLCSATSIDQPPGGRPSATSRSPPPAVTRQLHSPQLKGLRNPFSMALPPDEDD